MAAKDNVTGGAPVQQVALQPQQTTEILVASGQNVSVSSTVQGATKTADGTLVISFENGATLVVKNYDAVAAGGEQPTLTTSNGQTVTMAALIAGDAQADVPPAAQAAAADNFMPTLTDGTPAAEPAAAEQLANAETINMPKAGEDLIVTLEDGTSYTFGFAMNEPVSVKDDNGQLVITFKNGGEIIIPNYGAMKDNGGLQITLKDGSTFAAAEFGEMLASAAQLNAVEPAAGEAGGGAGRSGGFGFQSSFAATPFQSLDPIGPINPTQLNYGVNDRRPEPFLNQPPLPNLTVSNSQVDEDGSVGLNISTTPNNAVEQITITVTGFLPGWGVDTTASGGTYDPATGTWTITLNPGQSFSGGPIVSPPADSDADMPNLQVNLTVTNTSTGLSSSTSGVIDVYTNAVADVPDVAGSASGSEDTAIPLNITTNVTDTDTSEEITEILISGVPAGATLNNGVDLGGGVWKLTMADLNGLTITPPQHSDKEIELTVTVTATEVNLSGQESNLNDNTATNSTKIIVNVEAVPDQPTVSAVNKEVLEDKSVALEVSASLVDTDGSETLTVTISGIAAGWDVKWDAAVYPGATYDSNTGTWTFKVPAGTTSFTGGPTLSPPPNSDADLPNLVVTATATEAANGLSSSNSANFSVVTDAVIDAPSINAPDTSGAEDSDIALNITVSRGDDTQDGSEVLSAITISGVPADATLSAGTKNADGTWSVTAAQLNGLTLRPAANFNGKINLTVSVTDTETNLSGVELNPNNNSATVTDTMVITVNPVAETPTVSADDVRVKEDGSVQLVVKAALAADGPATDFLTVTISGIKAGWGVDTTGSGGTYNAATGTWTITLPAGVNFTGGPVFSPPANSDADLTGLTITATQTDPATNQSASATDTASIVVDAVIDAPTLDVDNAKGDEDTAIALDISATKGGDATDGSEVLSNVTISGVPAGATLSAGTKNADGTWTLTTGQLSGLTITPPKNYNGTLTLTVSVTDTEANLSGGEYDTTDNSATVTKTINVVVNPVADDPAVKADDVQVKEDGSVQLGVTANLAAGSSATDYLVVTISGIKAGWGVNTSASGGTYNAATGTWTIKVPAGQNYNGGPVFSPPADSDADMTGLVVTSTQYDAANNVLGSGSDTASIIVDAVVDAPVLTVSNTSGNEDTAIALNISATKGGDATDGSEVLSNVTITGVPAGATLSAGTKNADGSWTLTTQQLGGLKLTPAKNYNGTINLTVKVTDTETNLSGGEYDLTDNSATVTKNLTVTVKPVDDNPAVNANDVQVKEDGSVQLPVTATLAAGSAATDYMVVTISGIKAGWGVNTSASGGTYNAATGTWTIKVAAGQNYSGGPVFSPPADSDVDMTGLTVTATQYDASNAVLGSGSDTAAIIVDAVIDGPVLNVSNASGEEGSSIALDISVGKGGDATDGSEVLSNITITGVPAGATLSAGTKNADGSWTLTSQQLGGLKITPAAGYEGTINLTVKVTDTETNLSGGEYDLTDNSATVTKTLTVNVNTDDVPTIIKPADKVVDETNLTPGPVTVSGSVSANFYSDGPGSFGATGVSSFSFGGSAKGNALTSNGVPVVVTLVGNTYVGKAGGEEIFTLQVNANGSYKFDLTGTLDHANVTNPDDVINLNFGIKATDADGDTATTTLTVKVHDDGVTANDDYNTFFTGDTATGNVISGLNGGAGAKDDVSEDVPNTVFRVAFGSKIVDVPATGSATLEGDYGVLTINANGTYSYKLKDGVLELGDIHDEFIYVLKDADGDTDTALLVFDVPDAAKPGLTVNDEIIKEDGSGKLDIAATLSNSTDSLTVTVSGVPAGWTVDTSASGGTYNAATGTWTITLPAGQNFSGGPVLKPPADSDADIPSLLVTAKATSLTGTSATTQGNIKVIVDAVIDGPTLNVSAAQGNEDSAIDLSISVGKGGDNTDGSEVLSNITISGVPAGATLSAGTNMGGGVWSLTQSQLSGLKLIPAANYNGSFNLTVKVTDTETNLSGSEVDYTDNSATVTKTLGVTVKGVDDVPGVGADDVRVKEDHSVQLPVSGTLAAGSPATDYLVITISGIGAGWGVNTSASGGSYNASTGTWTRTVTAGQNYNGGPVLSPPANSDLDLNGLVVTVKQYNASGALEGTATDTVNIIVDAVIDAPTLSVNNVTGEENSAISLQISAGKGGDTQDGSEVLSPVTISGVPTGATLSTGTNLGGGVWSVPSDKVSTLKITPPAGYKGSFTLTVSVTDTETNLGGLEYDYTDNSATVTKTFTVGVTEDTVPTIGTPGTKEVDETNLKSGTQTVSGTVTANFFDDAPGTFSGAGASTFNFGGSVKGGALTSNGVAVVVTQVGNTYVGKAGSKEVFTLTINSNGTYSFALKGVLDHANEADHNDAINLSFGVKATDSDGDSASTSIQIKVYDDGPKAFNDNASLVIGEDGTGAANGNVITGLNGGAGAADTLSQDALNTISKIQFGTTAVNVPSSGSATIEGTYGTLKIFADGTYTYTLKPATTSNGVSTDSFIYTLKDADGDTSTATLNLNGLGSTFKVGSNTGDGGGSTTPYVVGTGTGKITGRGGPDILVGDVGGTNKVPVNKDYNIVMILDISGSMGYKNDPASKYSLLMDAVKNLMADFHGYTGGEVQIHLVPFYTSVHAPATFDLSTTAGYNAAINYINNMSDSGGFTNYEAGLQAALYHLKNDALPGADTYTYFISDGEPNRYVDEATNTVVTGTENTSMQQILGADGSNEVAELKALSKEVIGVGIDITNKIANINVIDSDGVALNITDANELTQALSSASPISKLTGVGADHIVGGDGNDMIFGDSLNTDALAASKNLGTTAGSGWEVFAKLEAGQSSVSPNWTRADTLNYIKANANALAKESTLNGSVRTGGYDRLEGGAGDDLIFGQEGDDVIIGGTGADVLYGGTGHDTFVFDSLGQGVDNVMDFSVSQGDILDISAIVTGYDPLTESLADFVKITKSGSDSILQVDTTGTGSNFQTVAVIKGVDIDIDSLAASGNLIA